MQEQKPWAFFSEKIFENSLVHMTTVQILRVTILEQNVFK